MTTALPSHWYIVQRDTGECDIVPDGQVGAIAPTDSLHDDVPDAPSPKTWGPFPSEGEAIARRVGLIRSGKCKPVMG